jgi:hypothetical protein
MDFGICLLSVIPVRSRPSDLAEMVTQLLFGELLVVNETKKNWLYIRILNDNYEGWVDEKQILRLKEAEFNRLKDLNPYFVSDLVEIIQNQTSKEIIPVVIGSSIWKNEDSKFLIAEEEYIYTGQLVKTQISEKIKPEIILEYAMSYLGAPYLWGGKSPFGIDCSGFVQVVYMMHGIQLPRDASQQAMVGEDISLLEEARAGDLLFFDNEEGQIIHVGIVLNDRKIIHASGKVRIDLIDHQGIYNQKLKKYTHKLRLIKRVI